ncbi:hypothetical protein ISN45_Aa08g012170 [Arabidopsis thaliana x Arabidopsis arenosa]|uniref:Uncharacterized protein n=1 Tax=Arabidopsis thaliana x Arabidopsis arenosa TaxID=1240361 RepID=A0A8T1XGD0_9BRAS|nr:hypothetical protein ISN45_Aa08g012170 [Arabidopsis thaliana x Arabidopsis arenosa]
MTFKAIGSPKNERKESLSNFSREHQSGGVVARDKYCQSSKTFRIQKYFHGLSKELSLHANTSSFCDLQVLRIEICCILFSLSHTQKNHTRLSQGNL